MTYSIIPLIISIVALLIAIYNIHKKREVDRAIAMIYKRQFEQLAERERRLMNNESRHADNP